MSEPTDLYRYYDANDVLLYVGISKSAIARAIQHQRESGWWEHYAWMTREVFPTREAALEAETAAIVAERPLHNLTHNAAVTSLRLSGSAKSRPVVNDDPLVGQHVHVVEGFRFPSRFFGTIAARVGDGRYLVQWGTPMGHDEDIHYETVDDVGMTEWEFWPTWIDFLKGFHEPPESACRSLVDLRSGGATP